MQTDSKRRGNHKVMDRQTRPEIRRRTHRHFFVHGHPSMRRTCKRRLQWWAPRPPHTHVKIAVRRRVDTELLCGYHQRATVQLLYKHRPVDMVQQTCRPISVSSAVNRHTTARNAIQRQGTEVDYSRVPGCLTSQARCTPCSPLACPPSPHRKRPTGTPYIPSAL